MLDITNYFVVVGDTSVARYDSCRDAVRRWDGETNGKQVHGGIRVQTWVAGHCTRDGWVLHVSDNGVYLNPNEVH